MQSHCWTLEGGPQSPEAPAWSQDVTIREIDEKINNSWGFILIQHFYLQTKQWHNN